jgi:hypothetical protein
MGPSYEAHFSPADKATLYVYRSSTIVGIADPDFPTLFINDVEATKLKIGGYMAVSLSPGEYDLRIMKALLGMGPQKDVVGQMKLRLSAGDTAYLKFKVDAFLDTVNFGFQVMDEASGSAEVSKTKMLSLVNDEFQPN